MADVRGCFFHFAQAVWRKVQALGLSGAYRESPEVKTFVRRLAVLPLVPLNEIENVWMDLHGMAPVEFPGIAELCDYMVITWVDDMQATFRRELWNHFQTLQEEGIRSNNHLESFHAAFNRTFHTVHPNIFIFVSGLKKRQDETETTVASLDAGNAPPPQKRQRKDKEDRIRRVLQQYQAGQRPVRSYMDAMCMTVKLGKTRLRGGGEYRGEGSGANNSVNFQRQCCRFVVFSSGKKMMKVFVLIVSALAGTVLGQCPSGFVHHGESCYAIPMAEGSWADGMMMCQELGGQLAVIETAAEQGYLEGFLQRYGTGLPNDADFWVGGGDYLQEGQWKWVMPDTPITHTFWAPGQPNNAGGSQGCLRVSKALRYKWEDGNCDSTEYAVCELPFRTSVVVGK
ncbi:hypothetical protein ACOMHN_023820 [Nucella lapillus]